MLERGVQVLQAFRPGGGNLSLDELITRTGLPKATTYRLAENLVELGMLQRGRHGYLPGLGLFELGELVGTRRELREAALPYMQDMYEATHQTIHLGIRDELDVVYAERIRGHHGVDVPSSIGGRLPLSCTAVGKALLASAPAEVIDAVLGRPLRGLTPHSVKDPRTLQRQLAEVRRTGFAMEREEAQLGVACAAAPVIVGGRAVAALSISARIQDFDAASYGLLLRGVTLGLARTLRPMGPERN